MDLTNRQIEIIQAATKLIGQGGVQSLTTKTLAKEMGFSEPALYRHFKDKNEILLSVLRFYMGQLKKGISDISEDKLSGLDKIKAVVDFQFGHFTKHPAIIMVIFAETSFQYDSVLSNQVSEIMRQKSKSLESIIKSGQEEGVIRKDILPQQLATIVMGSMRITILKWRLSNFKFDLLAEGQTLWATFELLLRKQNN